MKIQNPNYSLLSMDAHTHTLTDERTSPKQNDLHWPLFQINFPRFFFRDIKSILTRILTMDINYGNLKNIFYMSI